MRRYRYFVVLMILSGLLTACGSSPETTLWGTTESYSSFLWKRYQPQKMEQTLEFDFSEDAQRLIDKEIIFELVVEDLNRNVSTTDSIRLYKNGARCENNRMSINKEDHEVKVGIEFDPHYRKGTHTLRLRPVDCGGLDSIDFEFDPEGEGCIYVRKNNVTNPLAKLTILLSVLFAILFVIWLIISRLIINPYLKFSKITFDYGLGEITHRVGGCYKIICTNHREKISLAHKIFVGKVLVEVNDFWEQELTIKCGSRNMIHLITRGEYVLPDEAVRKEVFTIQNGKAQKVNIETT